MKQRIYQSSRGCLSKDSAQIIYEVIRPLILGWETPKETKSSTTKRRHPRYAEIGDGKERRRLVIRLHAGGWNAKSIAGYLDVSRKTVHEILRRFAEEQFAGLEDKSHARKGPRKVDI